MNIITSFSEKGGVGKTTLTALIGGGLALRGKRVLLLDTDGQGDLTKNMHVANRAGFFRFVKWAQPSHPDYVATRDIVERVPADTCPENLYIVPGSNESWNIVGSTNLQEIVGNLARRFRELESAFDYVLIDTQPSATTMHDAIGLITDWFICPTDPEPFSAYGGLRNTIQHIGHIREQSLARGRDKAKLMGIIPNKFRTKTVLHNHVLERLQEQYGAHVWQPLPLRTAIPEGQMMQTILMHDSPHLTTNAYIWGLVDRVEGRLAEATNHE